MMSLHLELVVTLNKTKINHHESYSYFTLCISVGNYYEDTAAWGYPPDGIRIIKLNTEFEITQSSIFTSFTGGRPVGLINSPAGNIKLGYQKNTSFAVGNGNIYTLGMSYGWR